MNTSLILLITGLINAPAFVVLFNKLFPSKVEQAKINNLNIAGEISSSGEWQKLYDQMKRDKQDLINQFNERILTLQNDHIEEIKSLKLEFKRITDAKDLEIANLKIRITALEVENEKFKNTNNAVDAINSIAGAIHTATDVGAAKLIDDINK